MRRFRGESGANAVEFALVLPILLMLVFGVLWGGMAYNQQLTLTQAAREGARFAATLPHPEDPLDPGWPSWHASVRDRIHQTSVNQLSATAGYTCIRVYDETGTLLGDSELGDPGPDPACAARPSLAVGVAGSQARIEIEVARPARFDFVFGGGQVRLRSNAVSRYEPSDPGS